MLKIKTDDKLKWLNRFIKLRCVLDVELNLNKTLYFNPLINTTKEPLTYVLGSYYTYNNWGEPEVGDRIDYILIGKGTATVTEYHVVDNSHDGIYSSDHCPIHIKTKIH